MTASRVGCARAHKVGAVDGRPMRGQGTFVFVFRVRREARETRWNSKMT